MYEIKTITNENDYIKRHRLTDIVELLGLNQTGDKKSPLAEKITALLYLED